MRLRWLHLPIVAIVLFSSTVFAADELMKLRRRSSSRFRRIRLRCPETCDPPKLELGKMLYFDPRLSASHAISCNSCHSVGLGGVDAQADLDRPSTGSGAGATRRLCSTPSSTPRSSGTDARRTSKPRRGPDCQPDRDGLAKGSTSQSSSQPSPAMSPRSRRRFPARRTRSLLANRTACDRGVRGDADHARLLRSITGLGARRRALTRRRSRACRLFMDKGCAACHNGINIGGGMYAPFGVVEKPVLGFLPPGRPRPIHGDKDRQRRVRVQSADAPQYRADRTLLP